MPRIILCQRLMIYVGGQVSKHCAGCQRCCPTLKHVLRGCPTFFFQGRYKWLHDSVLSTIFSALSSFLSNISHGSEDSTYISFVKEGQKQGLDRSHPGTSVPRRKLRCGSLGNVPDWLILGDGFTYPYQIPHSIVITALRPDFFM